MHFQSISKRLFRSKCSAHKRQFDYGVSRDQLDFWQKESTLIKGNRFELMISKSVSNKKDDILN